MKKLLFAILTLPFLGFTQDSSKFVVNTGITFSMFQQQVKAEVGDISGQTLVDNSEFGYSISGQYKITKWLGAGLYFRHDIGKRNSSLFNGFDPTTGATVTTSQVGGNYNEIWAGPIISSYYKNFTIDLGFGAIGTRKDDARIDLPSASGNKTGNFTTHPTIAWMLAFGGKVPASDCIDITFKAEYRVRYYTQRNGEAILNQGVEHGTQSFAPIFGASYKF